jgi:methylglyoxal synthase
MKDAILSPLRERKRIALVAHDHKKQDIVEWAEFNRAILPKHDLIATGTTGRAVEEVGLHVTRL